MSDKTIYTVPLHIGQNVEVPLGSVVTFYDPAERVDPVQSAMTRMTLYGTASIARDVQIKKIKKCFDVCRCGYLRVIGDIMLDETKFKDGQRVRITIESLEE